MFHPKAKKFFAGRKHLLRNMRYALIDERRPRIWMHCASLGEFEQGRPVLEQLRKKHPDHAIVLTFFSPSGYEVRKDYEGADHVFYLPLDSVLNAKRFLQIIQPKLCLFIKYELWYFLLREVANKDIPALLVSAIFRPEQPFFKWYGRLHRRMLHCFTHIFVQDKASAELLGRIDVNNVTVSGDTRFDRVVEAAGKRVELPRAKEFCADKKIIVAGSTWKEDELLLQELMQKLPPHYKLVLVPHEIDEAHLQQIEKLFGAAITRWTDADMSKRVFLVDKMGLLLSLYNYADVAWIGGGFGKEGVHNTLEAAVYSVPVTFGPVYEQYLEARELIAEGGAMSIDNAEVLAKTILQWEADKILYEQVADAAGSYVISKSGATKLVTDHIAVKNWLSVP